MVKLVHSETQAALAEIVELRNRALELDCGLTKVMIPHSKKKIKNGDREAVKQIINEIPAYNTRLKLAGLAAI